MIYHIYIYIWYIIYDISVHNTRDLTQSQVHISLTSQFNISQIHLLVIFQIWILIGFFKFEFYSKTHHHHIPTHYRQSLMCIKKPLNSDSKRKYINTRPIKKFMDLKLNFNTKLNLLPVPPMFWIPSQLEAVYRWII